MFMCPLYLLILYRRSNYELIRKLEFCDAEKYNKKGQTRIVT